MANPLPFEPRYMEITIVSIGILAIVGLVVLATVVLIGVVVVIVATSGRGRDEQR